MEILRLASPWLLLLALPAWGLIAYAALRPPRRRGAAARAALAAAAAGLLVAALAGPSVRTSRTGVCPVRFIQDDSASMAVGRAVEPAAALAPYLAALPPGRASVVQAPAATPAGGTYGTDLELALGSAAAALPDGQGLLVLYSDGRETAGDARRAAARLAARGVRVAALAPDLRPHDVRLAALEVDGEPAAGRTFALRVRVTATADVAAEVRLRRAAAGAVPAGTWSERMTVGPASPATLLFPDGPLPDGTYAYEAEVAAPGDGCPADDRARLRLAVGRPRTILYMYAGDKPGPLREVLRAAAPAGAAVAARPASAAEGPGTAAVVVLDNVPAWALGDRAAADLSRRVTDGGLGLLALGGSAAFAAGGYAESPLEALLPVSSRATERPPLAVVLVLDSSGSMNERAGAAAKIVLAKQAALSLASALAPAGRRGEPDAAGPADRLGAVAFSGEPRVLAPLGPADDAGLRAALRALGAGGGTRITPAVEAALRLYPPAAADDRTVRRIILLSDGRSEDFDIDALVAAAAAARVSVSAVATGADADLDRLGRLASGTGGRLYRAADFGRLAETFLEDLTQARGESLRPTPRPAAWLRPQPVWPAPAGPLPPVPALNLTRAKTGADVHWTTADGAAGPSTAAPSAAAPVTAADVAAPLLASWRRGLGRTAAMPWPVGDLPPAWTADGLLQRHLAAVLAALAPPGPPTDWTARLLERDGRWHVRVEERPSALAGPPAAFVATVLADAAAAPAASVTLPQVAPGIFEAAVQARTATAAVVVVHRKDAPDAARTLAAPQLPPAEFDRLGVDRDRLAAIARAGGGALLESPEALARMVSRMEMRGWLPVGVHLVLAAGAVVLAQVGLRLMGKL